jgi:hypothetical protein
LGRDQIFPDSGVETLDGNVGIAQDEYDGTRIR